MEEAREVQGRLTDTVVTHYFRHRDNGASVFRIAPENRLRRVELVEIAFVNVKNGNVRAHGGAVLTPEDHAAIASWLEERRGELAAREADDALRLADALNATAHWVQSRATAAEAEAVTDRLLYAMQDLREALVRRRAEAIAKDQA